MVSRNRGPRGAGGGGESMEELQEGKGKRRWERKKQIAVSHRATSVSGRHCARCVWGENLTGGSWEWGAGLWNGSCLCGK